MKIGLAQTISVPGALDKNIEHHVHCINSALKDGADLIVFPELSLTAYEPTIAKSMAMQINDPRLDVFQQMSDARQVTICIGVPINTENGVCIGMVIFQTDKPRQVYYKKHLHEDENTYFVPGKNIPLIEIGSIKIAFGICYELTVPEHAECASQNGADMYLMSVAKTPEGVVKARKRLTEIAKEYAMHVMMVNCIGPCEGKEGGGQSAVWNRNGKLIGQLEEADEGILMVDTISWEIELLNYRHVQ